MSDYKNVFHNHTHVYAGRWKGGIFSLHAQLWKGIFTFHSKTVRLEKSARRKFEDLVSNYKPHIHVACLVTSFRLFLEIPMNIIRQCLWREGTYQYKHTTEPRYMPNGIFNQLSQPSNLSAPLSGKFFAYDQKLEVQRTR